MTMAEFEAGASAAPQRSRPLSPHLQIYRPMLTMMMSIAHRITGAALYFGMLLLAWWLIAAASGPNAYANFEWFIGSWIGRLVLFGYTWALLHHMLGGIRHLIWDTLHGFEPSDRELLTLASLIGSVSLTLVIWVIGYLAMGGPR
jgi:succinate dehydrogenase / fumarate reductase cytochrome b subunit